MAASAFRTLCRSLYSNRNVLTNRAWAAAVRTRTQPYGVADIDTDRAYEKTRLTIMNVDEDDSTLFIDTYSQIGFKLNNGFRVIGPCALFPKSVLHWNVRGYEEINEDSLCLFYMTEPKLDLLILGVGERENVSKVKPDLIRFLKSKRLNVEILPTDHACSTFNFLNSEKRFVAAALIPPQVIQTSGAELSYLQDGDPSQVSDLYNPAALQGSQDNVTEMALGVHGKLGIKNLAGSLKDAAKQMQSTVGSRGDDKRSDGPDSIGRGPKY